MNFFWCGLNVYKVLKIIKVTGINFKKPHNDFKPACIHKDSHPKMAVPKIKWQTHKTAPHSTQAHHAWCDT